MFYVGNRPILVNEYEIIQQLQYEIRVQGIGKLKDITQSGNNIMVTCPVHKDGMESKPSCGIYKNNKEKPNAVHCLACGYTDTLEGFVSKCFNRQDNGSFGLNWLKAYSSEIATDRDSLLDIFNATNIRQDKPISNIDYINESELDLYRKKHPYMYGRRLTDDIIDKFDIGYDAAFKLKPNSKPIECITFPVRDKDNNILFIARRAIFSKLFHYPKSIDKPIYGINEVYNNNLSEIIVCESIINALTCWVYGKPAIALLGTGSYEQYKVLSRLPTRKLILGLDPDEAGFKGMSKIESNVKGKIITRLDLESGKDINDYSYSEFIEIQEKYL